MVVMQKQKYSLQNVEEEACVGVGGINDDVDIQRHKS